MIRIIAIFLINKVAKSMLFQCLEGEKKHSLEYKKNEDVRVTMLKELSTHFVMPWGED